tara:strand:+ start:399 stop:1013 length:615 start_codon:yes stop_codon:yes gene_type:complete
MQHADLMNNRERRSGRFFQTICHMIQAVYSSAFSRSGSAQSKQKETQQEQAGRLMTSYGNHIFRLAYSYLHNKSDAEDILQDTLIQYLKKHPQFESAEHEKAWLLRVAINLSKNKIKYNLIRKTDELNETLTVKKSEDLSYVWEAVKSLPVKYREVIHLYYQEGYSTAQTADMLSKKEATVRSLLRRARIKLKTVLKEAYDFEE